MAEREPSIISDSHRSYQSSKVLSELNNYEPKEAYTKVKEKLLELEIERDENLKALEYLK